jgi:cell division protein FtsQ
LLVRKKTRKNYFKNSAAKRKVRRTQYLLGIVKIVSGLLLVAAMSFAFIFSYDLFTQSEFFSTRKISVKGCERLKHQEVIDQAKLEPGLNIFSVNLTTTRKRLLAHPWISEADVSREIPEGIHIRIREHEPLAIIDMGRKFLLNRKGEIFKEWHRADPVSLPVVYGLSFSDLNVGSRPVHRPFKAVMAVLKLGLQSNSIIANRDIKSIHVDKDIGLTVYADNRLGALKLGYGDYSDKYKRLEEVLSYLDKKEKISDMKSIDLNNPDRIVVNLNMDNPPAVGHKEV